ncbi:MAG: hypothetical protein ACLRQF_03740 [Thomasclavelia ramosa]
MFLAKIQLRESKRLSRSISDSNGTGHSIYHQDIELAARLGQ